MGKGDDNTGKIAKSAGVVSIAVMCSRVLGLVREQVFATLFGAGFAYDAFVVAFRIPNLLRDLFGEGALSAAFVTVFSDYEVNRGEKETWQLMSDVLVGIGFLLSLLTILGIIFSGSIVSLIAPDFDTVAGKLALTTLLTQVMFPFLIFVSLAAVLMGVLNTKGKFFVPAMASSFFNLGSVAGGLTLALILPRFGEPAILGMAIGTLIGGFLQFAGQIPAVFSLGFRFRPRLAFWGPGLRRIFTLMVPAVVGLGATQINIFVNTNFAASCAEGSVSWLNYAFRLVQFPLGVFGVALSIAAMPVIAKCAAVQDMAGLKKTYASSLTMAFCLTIPASAGLFFLAEPIIRIIFEHGAFSSLDTTRTAQALSYYVIGLFAYSCVKITVPVFYALNDTKIPVISSFLAVAANIIFINLTIPYLAHRAIALSTSLAMSVNFIFLSIALYRKIGGYSIAYLTVGLAKVIAASALMGVWLYWGSLWLWGGGEFSFYGDVWRLALMIVGGVLCYGVFLYLLGLQELTTIIELLRKRLMGERGTDTS